MNYKMKSAKLVNEVKGACRGLSIVIDGLYFTVDSNAHALAERFGANAEEIIALQKQIEITDEMFEEANRSEERCKYDEVMEFIKSLPNS